MSTPDEDRQRETDRQRGEHERRMSDRARFGSPLAADLFDIGVAAARDVAAAEQLTGTELKRNVTAAESDEVRSEGRAARTKPDPKGEA